MLKDLFKIIRCEFLLKLKTILQNKSFDLSEEKQNRFYLKNRLLNFTETPTDFIQKKC